ncbi:hypothetical protein [Metabacillus niabensis]|uniref:Uncharacterized protein n=1 Tax=Metabacillus niabensis TaxID=324854 RepID=A0ABT9Z505_9BACI|nr:hypothetical protein [Metabacillus niabensis]MDQ0227336.1 hypothetical protein [Metabacillus niabensis]
MKIIRNTFHVLLIVTAVVGLNACGAKDPVSELQSKKWNVVATNGESYTAEFGPLVYELEKNGHEYNLKATTETIKEKTGDLTLSPSKE